MSKTQFYCQCVLRKFDGKTTREQVSYIPEEYAIQDNSVKLRDDAGVWVDGWCVESVGAKVDASYVETHERDYLSQRKASDIARDPNRQKVLHE